MQKGSPVLADGKLYVGTENGRVHILKPSKTGVEVLDDDALPISIQEGTGGAEPGPEPIVASPAVANGRVYIASMDALYAIGPKALKAAPAAPATTTAAPPAAAGPATVALVYPSDVTLTPGKAQKFTVNLFDANGNPAPTPAGTTIAWALDGLKGAVAADGTFTPDAAAGGQAGAIKATVGAPRGIARMRVALTAVDDNFDDITAEPPPAAWIYATGVFDVKDLEGSKVLQRREDNTLDPPRPPRSSARPTCPTTPSRWTCAPTRTSPPAGRRGRHRPALCRSSSSATARRSSCSPGSRTPR